MGLPMKKIADRVTNNKPRHTYWLLATGYWLVAFERIVRPRHEN